MTSSVDDFIEHHGVKGMQWGVRNKSQKQTSGEHRTASALRKKHVSQLTNRQLKIANERGNLEQNYNRLNPNAIAKGKAAAQGILGAAGMAVTAYSLFNSPAGKAFREAGKKKVESMMG